MMETIVILSLRRLSGLRAVERLVPGRRPARPAGARPGRLLFFLFLATGTVSPRLISPTLPRPAPGAPRHH